MSEPRTRFRRLALLAAVAAGLTLVTVGGVVTRRRGEARGLDDFGAASAFALTDQRERPFGSGDIAGKVVVASFIYTRCQDICPVVSLRMQALQQRLREQGLLGGRIQLLSFTVDPARDTPAVLRAYAEAHEADSDAWRFLSGPVETVVPLIVEGFRLGVEALPPQASGHGQPATGGGSAEYEVMHSGRLVLIDQRGRVRAYYDAATVDIERVMRDIQRLPRAG